MGGKNFGFPWKILQPANLKGGQKVCKKKGPKRFLIPPTFCKKKPDQQKSRIFSSKAVFFFDTPPPPLILFEQLFVRTGIFWRRVGIITLWIST